MGLCCDSEYFNEFVPMTQQESNQPIHTTTVYEKKYVNRISFNQCKSFKHIDDIKDFYKIEKKLG